VLGRARRHDGCGRVIRASAGIALNGAFACHDVHPAQTVGLQVVRGADRATDRARPHRHRRTQRLRQVQSARGAALGHGRKLDPQRARVGHGRRHLRRHRHAPGAQHGRGGAHPRQLRRGAPAQFNDAESLEISRRIERESGSDYRINGAEVRARDVQILFADASSGARSPALVRQGQISEIINAKPQSRRRILEEAAGITGLHVRRHEAELKLKGAETNLSRIDDVIGQLDTQLQGLKRQARQAIRYKELAGAIRRLEAAQLYLAWTAAVEAAGHEEASWTRRCGCWPSARAPRRAGRARDAAAEALPPLREDEMVRAAVLQRVSAEQANLDREMAKPSAARPRSRRGRADRPGSAPRKGDPERRRCGARPPPGGRRRAAPRPRPARSRPAAKRPRCWRRASDKLEGRARPRATRPRPGCRSSAPSAAKVCGAWKSSASAWRGSRPSLRRWKSAAVPCWRNRAARPKRPDTATRSTAAQAAHQDAETRGRGGRTGAPGGAGGPRDAAAGLRRRPPRGREAGNRSAHADQASGRRRERPVAAAGRCREGRGRLRGGACRGAGRRHRGAGQRGLAGALALAAAARRRSTAAARGRTC
jgi:hypothetical protein